MHYYLSIRQQFVTDREGIAITMAMGNAPQAVAMGLQKEYAERYDWFPFTTNEPAAYVVF